MMKRLIGMLFCSVLSLSVCFAGDVASFINLGFSEDGKYFMFGLYGVEQLQKKPYAEMYTVDTEKNEFVESGVKKALFDTSVDALQDGSGAFFTLFAENTQHGKKYKINYLKQGRLLYLLMNGEKQEEELGFRDFKTGDEYKVLLTQSIKEEKSLVSSSFDITIKITNTQGQIKTLVIGNPNFKRNDVKGYVIRQILLSQDEKYLVTVVEKQVADKDGASVRFMVETTKLK